jgi:hypothetical protein
MTWISVKHGKILWRILKLLPENVCYYGPKKGKPWFDEGCSKIKLKE